MEGVLWFFSHFNLSFTLVPLKDTIGLGKNICGHLNKSKTITCFFQAIFNAQKSMFSNPMATSNGTTVKLRLEGKEKHKTPPSKLNIE